MNILVINAGSSSLKYQLYNMESGEVMAKGVCERIGSGGQFTHKKLIGETAAFSGEIPFPTHAEAMEAVIDKLIDPEYGVLKSMSEIDAVGHRVAHGGEFFSASAIITDEVISSIEATIPLAPLHNPANITGIKATRAIIGDVPMVAVFDTAFHLTMPNKAFIYALPYEFYQQDQIRRYGFHGTSHRFVSARAAEIIGKPLSELKLISLHLGNGSSICAINGGKSIDTSMGFTPVDGLPMGTRSGELDPGIIQFLMNRHGYTIDEILNILNKESGMLGISGVSSDFRDLDEASRAGNERAKLAVEVFCYKAAKTVGSYAAALNGVDGIIFTAGVGEHDPVVRAGICSYLHYLGCDINLDENTSRAPDIRKGSPVTISTPDSKIKVMVIPTNEELVIANDTLELIKAK